MKLSKSLLQAIVIGVSIGTASTSCTSLFDKDLHLSTCQESCDIDHAKKTSEPYDCPACGMG